MKLVKSETNYQRLVYGEVSEGYWVSTDGKIWSTRPLNGRGPLLPFENRREMKPARQANGYFTVVLDRKTFSVHCLVLNTFVGPSNGKQCRHLDGDKTNNAKSNLCWGTATEQSEDRELHGTKLKGSTIGTAKLTEAQVSQIKSLYPTQTLQAIGELFKVSKHCIHQIVTGKSWRHV